MSEKHKSHSRRLSRLWVQSGSGPGRFKSEEWQSEEQASQIVPLIHTEKLIPIITFPTALLETPYHQPPPFIRLSCFFLAEW